MKHITHIIAITIAIITILLAPLSATASPSCKVADKTLLNRAVLIEKFSQGKGSGVLYNKNTVLTNHHVIEDVEHIWVYIPTLQKSIKATLLYSTPKPDIAVLRLEEDIPNTSQVTIATKIKKNELIKLSSFPFGEKHRLGITLGAIHAPARMSKNEKVLYFSAYLEDWAFAGDSGGGFYNCAGELIGLNFGNLVLKGQPKHIFAVNYRSINQALSKAKIQ